MRKIEKENGETVFVFESHESEQKKLFERGLMMEEAVDDAYLKLIESLAEAKLLTKEAWRAVEDVLEREFGAFPPDRKGMSYDWKRSEIRFLEE